jgi:hypothetical protein
LLWALQVGISYFLTYSISPSLDLCKGIRKNLQIKQPAGTAPFAFARQGKTKVKKGPFDSGNLRSTVQGGGRMKKHDFPKKGE